MAPTPVLVRNETEQASSSNNQRLWIVIGTIAGILVLSGIITVIIVLLLKYRQRSYLKVRSTEWPLPKIPLPNRHSGQSTRESLEADHEHQRQYIIQKSLAGRGASHDSYPDNQEQVTQCMIQKPANSPMMVSEPQKHSTARAADEQEGCQSGQSEASSALVRDFKEWEAKLRREGGRSLQRHPGIENVLMGIHTHQSLESEYLKRNISSLGER
ncbi:hypothetical protein QQS21_009176 [Conoideocrella luteorostrata]|uniref:Uncharacterized protein n=1 Tax=Conoideocrella luteorostrata TaxID=1105319 RepID=A0AAJ0FQN7_9HYPO|nr:hypothetical protein QQS21_009176 [Conoideocrella luteorostrata]